MVDKFIYRAPIIYVEGFFYVSGGESDAESYVTTIGRLDAITMQWSKAGDLVYARRSHNVIYEGSSLVVVGGLPDLLRTEKCTISNDQVSCTAQNPSLENYAAYPELFLVPVGYCKTLP